MDDIYSPENIARSRSRAAHFRELVAEGTIDESWLVTAGEVEAYAEEREKEAAARAERHSAGVCESGGLAVSRQPTTQVRYQPAGARADGYSASAAALVAKDFELLDYRAERVDGVGESTGEQPDGVGVALDVESLDRTAVSVERGDDALQLSASNSDVVFGHESSPLRSEPGAGTPEVLASTVAETADTPSTCVCESGGLASSPKPSQPTAQPEPELPIWRLDIVPLRNPDGVEIGDFMVRALRGSDGPTWVSPRRSNRGEAEAELDALLRWGVHVHRAQFAGRHFMVLAADAQKAYEIAEQRWRRTHGAPACVVSEGRVADTVKAVAS